MTDLLKLAEAVRKACEEYVNNDAAGCDVFHSFDEVDLQAIIAAHAKPEPVPDGEKMAEQIKELRRCIAVVNDHNYPVMALAASRLSDLLERTEAARLAAENKLAQKEEARSLYEAKAYDALEQLAAERDRKAKLAPALLRASNAMKSVTIFVNSREKCKKPEGMDWWQQEIQAADSAYQSSQENGK